MAMYQAMCQALLQQQHGNDAAGDTQQRQRRRHRANAVVVVVDVTAVDILDRPEVVRQRIPIFILNCAELRQLQVVIRYAV